MARADRLDRLDIRRIDLEADYRATLIGALRRTASGKPGLFGRGGDDRKSREGAVQIVENLTSIGEAIDQARELLALARFELHHEFLAARGPVGPQAVGETRQARAWLDRLAATCG